MLTIRTRTFDSADTADKVFSRLDWKVEKSWPLVDPLLSHSTTDTVKPWVGMLDRNKREFTIIQTAPFFSPRVLEANFFQLYVYGKVYEDGQKSKIQLEFKPGQKTMVLLAMFYFMAFNAVLLTITTAEEGVVEWKGLLLSLLIPLLVTLLLILQLNRTENKLIDLLET